MQVVPTVVLLSTIQQKTTVSHHLQICTICCPQSVVELLIPEHPSSASQLYPWASCQPPPPPPLKAPTEGTCATLKKQCDDTTWNTVPCHLSSAQHSPHVVTHGSAQQDTLCFRVMHMGVGGSTVQ